MIGKPCKKCGVSLCDKNKIKIKKHIRIVCKSCHNNTNYCTVIYNSEELNILSKKICKKYNHSKAKKKYYRNNILKYKEYHKEYQKEYQKEKSKILSDYYIKRTLLIHDKMLSSKNITPELIELKRKQLILKRNVKKDKNKQHQ